MDTLLALPIGVQALLIFCLRIMDVSMGTVRTLAVVSGRTRLSVVLGFFEVLIWVLAISQVLAVAGKEPLLLLAWAAGFATGNATGIWIERRLAMGKRVLRIISPCCGHAIAERLRDQGQAVTTFEGQGRDGPRTLLYLLCDRKRVPEVLDVAHSLDPEMFFVVESVTDSGHKGMALHNPTGWRAVMKKK
ncbi:MAG: DUF2179 domain-containing protein [Candidatus Cloacimonetes bacterium]|nr:DUF2179 domain-containing protein [Candidatus Cloacimonadota bacterium]